MLTVVGEGKKISLSVSDGRKKIYIESYQACNPTPPQKNPTEIKNSQPPLPTNKQLSELQADPVRFLVLSINCIISALIISTTEGICKVIKTPVT